MYILSAFNNSLSFLKKKLLTIINFYTHSFGGNSSQKNPHIEQLAKYHPQPQPPPSLLALLSLMIPTSLILVLL